MHHDGCRINQVTFNENKYIMMKLNQSQSMLKKENENKRQVYILSVLQLS